MKFTLFQILDDIENDEVIIEDDLADLIDDTSVGSGRNGEQCSITWTSETEAGVDIDSRLPVKIEKALEEGIGKFLLCVRLCYYVMLLPRIVVSLC